MLQKLVRSGQLAYCRDYFCNFVWLSTCRDEEGINASIGGSLLAVMNTSMALVQLLRHYQALPWLVEQYLHKSFSKWGGDDNRCITGSASGGMSIALSAMAITPRF